jgi:thiol-disulfide isomerase/thioredoxin
MKKTLIVFMVMSAILMANIRNVSAYENKVTAIYFYSTSCSTCQKLTSFLNNLEDKHKNLILKKYNIADLKNKSLLDKYNKVYNVSIDDEGIVPVIFIKNVYLTGEKMITEKLEDLIQKNDGLTSIEIQDTSENHDADIKQFMNFKTFSVFIDRPCKRYQSLLNVHTPAFHLSYLG